MVNEAVKYASAIAANSPDSIICTRAGLREGWESSSVERAVEITLEREFAKLQKGENILEGTNTSITASLSRCANDINRFEGLHGEAASCVESFKDLIDYKAKYIHKTLT